MNKVLQYMLIVAIIALSAWPSSASAQRISNPEPKDAVRGCWVHGWDTAHDTPVFDFFVKVADKETDGEQGAEIWGYRPDDPPKKDKNGYRWLNIPERLFVRAGTFKNIGGHACRCRWQ